MVGITKYLMLKNQKVPVIFLPPGLKHHPVSQLYERGLNFE